MKRTLFWIIGIGSFSFSSGQDSLLNLQLKNNAMILNYDGNEMTGVGMNYLIDEGSKSPFLLVGEAHGIAEIPVLAEKLFNSLAPYGYNTIAVETGPYTAEKLSEMTNDDDWKSRLTSHYSIYPWSIPFFNTSEEGSMLREIQTKNEEVSVWGLDQEFAASYRMFFNDLVEMSKSREQKQIANEYYQLAVESFRESFETKNPTKSILLKLQSGDFEKLRSAFGSDKRALSIIEELDVSLAIYQKWFTRQGYQSNFDRAMLMKKHFMSYYQTAKSQGLNPKVLVKLGSNHAYRGLNGLNVPDIGNLLSEMANQEGKQSFHIYVTGKSGYQNAFNPFSQSESDKSKEFKPSLVIDQLDLNSIPGYENSSDWVVINLRPLRSQLFNRTLKGIDKDFERLIWGYDALVIIPETSASTNY